MTAHPRADFTFAELPTPVAISARTAEHIANLRQVVARVSALSTNLTFTSTYATVHRAMVECSVWTCRVTLGSMVHTDRTYRDAFGEAKDAMRREWDAFYADPQLFAVLKAVREGNELTKRGRGEQDAVAPNNESNAEKLDWMDERFMDKMLKVFERNGVTLDADKRQDLIALRKKIGALESAFAKNLAEDETVGECMAVAMEACRSGSLRNDITTDTREELAGCPVTFIDSLKTRMKKGDDGKDIMVHIVMTKAPHLPVILDSCHVAGMLLLCGVTNDCHDSPPLKETRRKHLTLSSSKCALENGKIMEDLVKARADAALLLGHPSWASYKLANTMAKNQATVEALLERVRKQTAPLLDHDVKALLEMKRKFNEHSAFAHEEKLHLWDISFYDKMYWKETFGLDEKLIKEFFPLEWVLKRVFEIYQTLFSLRFEQLPTSAHGWHESVKAFAVYSTAASSTSGEIAFPGEGALVGYFFLDLFARPGKYAHQCVIPLSTGYNDENGMFQPPIACNISNLTAPSPTTPSLLSHSEVRTFFHEFGHVVHCICTRSPYVNMSWSWDAMSYPAGVEVDFLEVPSQALENWVWEPQSLALLSGHFEKRDPTSGQPASLPRELMEKLKQARMSLCGFKYSRQIFMTYYDLAIHSAKKPPTSGEQLEIWSELQRKLTGMETIPGTYPMASWYHLAMGYDAGYFSYLWSEIISHDFYRTRFGKAGNILDPVAGREYRDIVLAAGALIDGDAIAERFLGRPFNEQAFADVIGGKV